MFSEILTEEQEKLDNLHNDSIGEYKAIQVHLPYRWEIFLSLSQTYFRLFEHCDVLHPLKLKVVYRKV